MMPWRAPINTQRPIRTYGWESHLLLHHHLKVLVPVSKSVHVELSLLRYTSWRRAPQIQLFSIWTSELKEQVITLYTKQWCYRHWITATDIPAQKVEQIGHTGATVPKKSEILAPKAERAYISVVLSLPVYGNLL